MVLRVGSNIGDPALAGNPNLRFVPYALHGLWGLARKMVAGDTSTALADLNRGMFVLELEVVGRMYRDSVPLLAGSDEPNPYTIPGFSLHDELGLLVAAGLSPMAALQAATRSPALMLGALDSLGTIETGKVADLVLLAANPLDDIANTRRIDAVVIGGTLLDRPALDRMLASASGSSWRLGVAALILGGAIAHRVPTAVLLGLAAIPVLILVGLIIWRRRSRSRRR